MGLLSLFSKPAPTLLRLTPGSFTVDRSGRVVVSTLPSSFPADLVSEIGAQMLGAFREAEEAQLPLAELIINYPNLRIMARELRGGAMVFLALRTPYAPNSQP